MQTGPADLALTFTSPFDGSQQPYRLYLPSAADGTARLPLLLLLHGTSGDQNKYFEHETYHNGIYKREAEQQGVILLAPYGRDSEGLPTEWRGEAEINILALIDEVVQHYPVDPDRLVCSGQSMGGTGTTYLCCRYPDLFAAGIPLASTYGHVSLVTNLRHVPMFYVQGADDWPIYAATGPIPIVAEMQRLDYNGRLWMIPGQEHNTMGVSTTEVVAWATQQKRTAHPRRITHRAYFPAHGRAWWLEITSIAQPGWFAEVDAIAHSDNRIELRTTNCNGLILRPDPHLYQPEKVLTLVADGGMVAELRCQPDQEITLRHNQTGGWAAAVTDRHLPPLTNWQESVLGTMPAVVPTWDGSAETTLGNLLADAMREISGADIAICVKGHHLVKGKPRGAIPRSGQPLRLMELINWLRPLNTALARFTISGSRLLEIIELNISNDPAELRFLIQVSGCRYSFDRKRPVGSRVVTTDIDPDRHYTIVCNSSNITRTDSMHLGPWFGKLNHELLEPNILSTVWYYLQQHNSLESHLEGRIVEL